MELGISSYSYFGAKSASFSMDDAIKHAKSTGFDGMEFLYGERHGDLSCIDSMKYFSDKCAESGLKTYCCDGGINLMAQDMKEQIENGKALQPDTLMKICNILSCKITDILETKKEDDSVCTVLT